MDLDIGIQIKDLHLFQPGVNNIGYGIAIIQTLFVSLLIGGGTYFSGQYPGRIDWVCKIFLSSDLKFYLRSNSFRRLLEEF